MKLAIASDHGGYALKKEVEAHLTEQGVEFVDLGCHNTESCDYPAYAKLVGEAVTTGGYDLGLLFCGTGIGMSMAANKVKGVRAACCSDSFSAKFTRMHNNANVLCLGGRVVGAGLACQLVDLFITTEFEGGRHQRRIDQITAIEEG
jgi:ribose 5-phosphate isomerase B